MNPELEEKINKRMSVAEATVMALATIATAWCSYQASGWGGKGSGLTTEAQKWEGQAALVRVEGHQKMTVHAGIFLHLLEAQHHGKDGLAKFIIDRFPPDVKKAYEAWLAQKPLENPNAAAHPFVPELFEPPGEKESAELRAKSA